jgi:GMP synthase-like glutamine amidotransferase
MRVHYLQHVSFEGLGSIEQWLNLNGHTITSTNFFEAASILPPMESFDALIIMGGPMGVNDDNEYVWLKPEKEFIKNCITSSKKVLGICLGAQLVADSLGAKVLIAPNKEIGWFAVKPTNGCKEIGWFYKLFENKPIVFHWHGDRFEIPSPAENLLDSEANSNQAFIYNEKVIGLQFHLEVTEESLSQMLHHGSSELSDAPFVNSMDRILADSGHISESNSIMAKILQRWMHN